MIICDENKFIFIHIPKNSGTEMSKAITSKYTNASLLDSVVIDGKNIGIDKMHLYTEVIGEFIPKNKLDNYFKFCIVRNPYNKLYSAWNFIKDRHGYENVNDFVKYKLTNEFIHGKELIPLDARVHYRPQHTFVYDCIDNKQVDFIIKYENLNNDINQLNNEFHLEIPLYGNDLTCKKDYTYFFNKESIEKINKLYEKDFLMFDYKIM
jgi:hypothetical protein